MPHPAGLPAAKPTSVHKAQHPERLLVGIKTQVGMFGQLLLRGEPEITRHPEAKDYVHRLVRLCCLWPPFQIITLQRGQGELYFLPSGNGCDAISLTGKGHIGTLADLRFYDWPSKNHSIAHFVHIKAGEVELRSLRHFVGTKEAALQLQRIIWLGDKNLTSRFKATLQAMKERNMVKIITTIISVNIEITIV